MDDMSTKAERKRTAQYSLAERKEYVRLFLSNQPITRQDFCAQHGLGRKSLARWICWYSDDVKADGLFAADTTQPGEAASDNEELYITIPYSEYHELLRIKDKYNLVRALTQ